MSKIDEAKDILKQLGFPEKQQNDRSARVLLALLSLKEGDSWSVVSNNTIRIHEMIIFIEQYYGFDYKENSRESIRRQTIHQFMEAALVVKNIDDPKRSTNSGKTVYSVTDESLNLLKSYGSPKWKATLRNYLKNKKTLVAKYKKARSVNQIRLNYDGHTILFSSGKHNLLQKAIIQDFGSIFAPGADLLYVGDTANKSLFINEEALSGLKIPFSNHDKLPDVLIYDKSKKWLFLCEAVTSHGPISPKRVSELEKMFKNCPAGKVYVTCFLDKKTFRKYAADIAWDTEAWIAEDKTHMLHYNGDRFLGPR